MRYQEITFDASPEVLSQGVRVIVLTMGGIQNKETDPGFEKLSNDITQRIAEQISTTALQEDRILQGFRDLHTSFGFSNRNFPAASESLIAYILKHHRLPRVNLLVDIYNLVSVETRLALGAHDLARVTGNVHLRFTSGNEGFLPLGSTERQRVRPGAYAYIDDDDDVICMLEVKQVEKTKVTLETSECLFILQGNAETEFSYIESTAERLISLTKRFCGGQEGLLYREPVVQSRTILH